MSAHRVEPNPGSAPRIGVLVVAYNASSTLVSTLERLPESFREQVDHILVSDDCSQDDTYEVGLRFANGSTLPMTVIRHEQNLGYGGNQKAGYDWAMTHGLDVVVLLHGDGQYAPECIEDLVAPLVDGDADAVFGSRMMIKGGARAGGMPAYKLVGNRILTTFQNRVGLDLSEWHSGYRAYRIDALRALELEAFTNDFDFDTQIILGLHQAGSGSPRCRSRPTTAMRSATSTGSPTPRTSPRTSSPTASARSGSGRAAGTPRPPTT